MGAVCKLGKHLNQFLMQNVPLRGVLKGLQLSKFS